MNAMAHARAWKEVQRRCEDCAKSAEQQEVSETMQTSMLMLALFAGFVAVAYQDIDPIGVQRR